MILMTLATATATDVATTTDVPTVTTVSAKAFAGLLTDVALFASKEDHLPALCGIQLQRATVDGKAVIVARATDRYSLAEGWVHCDGDTVWPQTTILIPTAGIKQILAVLKSTRGMAVITVTEDVPRGPSITVDNFSTQATVFCSDADFPRVASLWPSGDGDALPVVRTFARDQLKRPAAVSMRRGDPLRIHWNGTTGTGGVLMTAGDAFRVVVMSYRNDSGMGDGHAYAAPLYR